MTTPIASELSYRSLKHGQAAKSGPRSVGSVHYRILTDVQGQQLYLVLTGNDGGGCYSKEIVPFERVEQCLKGLSEGKPIASKQLQAVFVGKSANNAGFLAAILRAEQLLVAAPDAGHQHCIQPQWDAWKQSMRALLDQSEPFVPEMPKPRFGKSAKPVADAASSEPLHDDTVPDDVAESQDSAELTETELALLQGHDCTFNEPSETSDEDNATSVDIPLRTTARDPKKSRRDKPDHSDKHGEGS